MSTTETKHERRRLPFTSYQRMQTQPAHALTQIRPASERRTQRAGARRAGGFTLLEITIVVGLIALLATISFPRYVRARENSAKSTCMHQLRELDSAKQQWGLENNKTNNDSPSNSDVVPYLKARQLPQCPGQGIYSLGNLATPPNCNLAGHVL